MSARAENLSELRVDTHCPWCGTPIARNGEFAWWGPHDRVRPTGIRYRKSEADGVEHDADRCREVLKLARDQAHAAGFRAGLEAAAEACSPYCYENASPGCSCRDRIRALTPPKPERP